MAARPALPHFEDNVIAAMAKRRTDKPAKGQEYVIGFEYQITDNAREPGRDGERAAASDGGAVRYVRGVEGRRRSRSGEFNHSRIVARGTTSSIGSMARRWWTPA